MAMKQVRARVQNAELVSQWAADISEAVRLASNRPQSLLVFVNPFGGAKKAGKVWQEASPVFQLTGEYICMRCATAATAALVAMPAYHRATPILQTALPS